MQPQDCRCAPPHCTTEFRPVPGQHLAEPYFGDTPIGAFNPRNAKKFKFTGPWTVTWTPRCPAPHSASTPLENETGQSPPPRREALRVGSSDRALALVIPPAQPPNLQPGVPSSERPLQRHDPLRFYNDRLALLRGSLPMPSCTPSAPDHVGTGRHLLQRSPPPPPVAIGSSEQTPLGRP